MLLKMLSEVATVLLIVMMIVTFHQMQTVILNCLSHNIIVVKDIFRTKFKKYKVTNNRLNILFKHSKHLENKCSVYNMLI